MSPSFVRMVVHGIIAYIVVFVTIVIVTALGGCRGAHSPRASLYGAELLACVEKAKSRTEADTCRRAVDCHYGEGPCPDGGSDAGGD